MRKKIVLSSAERTFQPPPSCRWYERPIITARKIKPSRFQVDAPDAFGWLSLSSGAVAFGAAFFFVMAGHLPVSAFLWPLATCAAFAMAGRWWRGRKNGRDELERERMEFLDGYQWDTWFTSVGIYRNGSKIGQDNGVVWFEEGSLMFSGLRCSFAISGEDSARALCDMDWKSSWIASFSPAYLCLNHPTDTVLISFRPAQSATADHIFINKLFLFRQFRAKGGPYRQYPPLERPESSVQTAY